MGSEDLIFVMQCFRELNNIQEIVIVCFYLSLQLLFKTLSVLIYITCRSYHLCSIYVVETQHRYTKLLSVTLY